MGKDIVSLHRRPGCPFDDQRAEDYAHSRAGGSTIHVASNHADVSFPCGKRLEGSVEMRDRMRELRGKSTTCTRSPDWFLEMYARNAERAAAAAEAEADGKKKADLCNAVSKALDGGLKALAEFEGLGQGGGPVQLSQSGAELRAELQRRLRLGNGAAPIAATVVAEAPEAVQ